MASALPLFSLCPGGAFPVKGNGKFSGAWIADHQADDFVLAWVSGPLEYTFDWENGVFPSSSTTPTQPAPVGSATQRLLSSLPGPSPGPS